MNDKNRIYELLQKNRLTSKEISESLNLNEVIVRVNISRLIKENKVRKLNEKIDRYCIYTAVQDPKEKSQDKFKKGFKQLSKFFDETIQIISELKDSSIKNNLTNSLENSLNKLDLQLIDLLKKEVESIE